MLYIFSIPSCYDIGGGQRPTQLAKTFNKNGFNIIYIYLFKPWPNTDDSIDVYASKHLYIDKLNINSICFNSDDIVIFESPSKAFEPYLDKAYSNNSKIIYENIDNWETSLGDKVYDYDTLVKMLQKSTLVIATAKKLLDQTKDYLKKLKIKKDVLYLPNAVDESIFNPYMEYEIPKDFVKGKWPKTSFFGIYDGHGGEGCSEYLRDNLYLGKTIIIALISNAAISK